DPVWFAAFMWVVVAHATFAGILFLVMLLERRGAEQRSFAMSDPLTGLMNRRAFADFAERMGRRQAALRCIMELLVTEIELREFGDATAGIAAVVGTAKH